MSLHPIDRLGSSSLHHVGVEQIKTGRYSALSLPLYISICLRLTKWFATMLVPDHVDRPCSLAHCPEATYNDSLVNCVERINPSWSFLLLGV